LLWGGCIDDVPARWNRVRRRDGVGKYHERLTHHVCNLQRFDQLLQSAGAALIDRQLADLS
jgi:hypothetical protein